MSPLPVPSREHQWLQQLVGDWTFEADAPVEDNPSGKCGGKESVRSIGGLWILGEGRGEMPGGGEATTLLTLGYDPALGRFVGSWVGSMMTNIWIYNGSLNEAGNILTLDTEGPDFETPGKTARYQDAIEMVDGDRRVLSSQVLGADGEWRRIMTAHYRRVK